MTRIVRDPMGSSAVTQGPSAAASRGTACSSSSRQNKAAGTTIVRLLFVALLRLHWRCINVSGSVQGVANGGRASSPAQLELAEVGTAKSGSLPQ